MSNEFGRAEAIINNFELKIAADYGSTTGRHPSDIGQDIPDAPESVETPIVEAGEMFYEGLDNATPFATDEELDEAENYFEQAFEMYEEALENHLDYKDFQNLVDIDVVIDCALNGNIDEESVVEAAGLPSSVMDDLESDQSHIRRNMDDEEAYDFIEDSEYDAKEVVRENYLRDVREAQEAVQKGVADIR